MATQISITIEAASSMEAELKQKALQAVASAATLPSLQILEDICKTKHINEKLQKNAPLIKGKLAFTGK